MAIQYILKRQQLSVVFMIKEETYNVMSALNDEFQDLEFVATSQLSLLCHWMTFLESKSSMELLSIAFALVQEMILPQNIHIAASQLEEREFILAAYYSAQCKLANSLYTKSALLESSATAVFAVFGGQGRNEEYLLELQTLYETYPTFSKDFISLASEVLDLPVFEWLQTKELPPLSYSASVPISFPLIGLTQLLQYYISCRILNLTPGEMNLRLKGVSGHSQGIVSAIVISLSDSFESFRLNFVKGLKLLQSIGKRSQEAVPIVYLDTKMMADCRENEGSPSSMLSISGLDKTTVQKYLDSTNGFLSKNSALVISLTNGPKNFVITGSPKSLYGLVLALRKIKASSSENQSKIPHSKRNPVFTMRFLPVQVPFHNSCLSACVDLILDEEFKGEDLWGSSDLHIPVYDTFDGSDLRDLRGGITRRLCELILCLPINWNLATNFSPHPTHILDFGPGGSAGIGPLTFKKFEGTGVHGIVVGNSNELYDSQNFKVQKKWSDMAPKLVKDSNGKFLLDTALSRLTGKPPIWCCGMTPSTVSGDFVTIITNAGYSVELAGGGHYNAKMLRDKVDYIKDRIEPGHGITISNKGIILNSLYINQRQWTFQYPLWCQLRKEGYPIEGLTVAAGIPSHDVAKEMIFNLKQAGIKYVSFKPGSTEGIRQVVNIASASPDFPIILQWTGGRAGGHHSYEDFHAPLISTYGSIRQAKNIVLLVGSGFGTSVETYPYLTGEWSLKYDLPLMPADGLLFGSRLMVAKECPTSLAVKKAIVDAPGVEDNEWEGTYVKETGGILTVKSELGEPIHKLATRGVKLWKEFDDLVFSLPKEKRVKWLEENRNYVINRLNNDFQKPWFARKLDGTVSESVNQMTYEEVAFRMTDLMYVAHQSRWTHLSYRDLVGDFLMRIEERFMPADRNNLVFTSAKLLDVDPFQFLRNFFKVYPKSSLQLLSSEDVELFYTLCQRPGSKPVPFVPILDERFEIWFKKDSLWQSEDLDSVVDQDVGRICILQGPVAVKHSRFVDEPVEEILNGIERGLVTQLMSNVSETPEYEVSSSPDSKQLITNFDRDAFASEHSISAVSSNGLTSYTIKDRLPPTDLWLEFLASHGHSWFSALLQCSSIVQGKSFVDNPFRRLLKPRLNETITIQGAGDDLTLFSADRSLGISIQGGIITCGLMHKSAILELKFQYFSEKRYAPIHEVMDCRNNRIQSFYYQLWFNAKMTGAVSVKDTFHSTGIVGEDSVSQFCQAVKNLCPAYVQSGTAPMDYAIVLGWSSVIKALFAEEINGDFLRLVHLSNGFKTLKDSAQLKTGDVVETNARVRSILISESGKTVHVVGILSRSGQPLLEISSRFLFRGSYSDFCACFEEIDEDLRTLDINSAQDWKVLQSKGWFTPVGNTPLVGKRLIFQLNTRTEFDSANDISTLVCSGNAYFISQTLGKVVVGSIAFQGEKVLANPVIAFLQRNGALLSSLVPLENPILLEIPENVYKAPEANEIYAAISGDSNPIHVNQYFASYASLPSTITHGMWTSAFTRTFLDMAVTENQPELVRSFQFSFVGMVNPLDILKVRLTHTAMINGAKVVHVETLNENGDVVLVGTAEIGQPRTAFVFTGQGSQEQGMGMDLYATSAVARSIWDKADAYLRETYSFSIIDIVKNNPKEKTIHFGGFLGQRVRDRYMAMSYDEVDFEGNSRSIALFPDISLSSTKYHFTSSSGLLYSTQFAQIALVVMEKAAFEDMRYKGLVDLNTPVFAGHSLGEYAALASVADFLSINSLCDIVFYRGLTMQRAVERDDKNRSNFAMCAANPSRVGLNFNEDALKLIINKISSKLPGLCEIVNFNVENQQYVVAGELEALDSLTSILNFLKLQKIDVSAMLEVHSTEKIDTKIDVIVSRSLAMSRQKKEKDGFIALERGVATIPLQGIDIPFHSSHIWNGVGPFRSFLSRKINRKCLDVDTLVGKYVPNLTAIPFSVEKDYVQLIFDQTASPRLEMVLRTWNEEHLSTPEGRQNLGYVILIELLAYQFASPVRWIETQDVLFSQINVQRLIEVGPSPVLTGMAARTLKLKYDEKDTALANKRELLCVSKNFKEIFYQVDPILNSEPAIKASPIVEETKPGDSLELPKPDLKSLSISKDPVPDEPVAAIDIISSIVAQKLKKPVTDLNRAQSVKELVGGKSTLQNEIMGDLQSEFSFSPERGEEIPLDELGAIVQNHHNGKIGKHIGSMISRLLNQKFPGGFPLSAVREYLMKFWGLGEGRVDSVLVRGLTNEPSARLSSEADAKAWLDKTVLLYAGENAISLLPVNASSTSSSQSVPAINSEEFEKYKKAQNVFASQHIELYNRYLGKSSRQDANLFAAEKARSEILQSALDRIYLEHGERYLEGIASVFDPLKIREFDSSWNWVKQDSIELYYDVIFGRITEVDRDITAKCIAIINRADPALLMHMRYRIQASNPKRGANYAFVIELGNQLLENCELAVDLPPKCKDVTHQTAPSTSVTDDGLIQYSEISRPNIRHLESYVKEMAAGNAIAFKVNLEKIHSDVGKLYEMVKLLPQTPNFNKEKVKELYDEFLRSINMGSGRNAAVAADHPTRRTSIPFASPAVDQPVVISDTSLPFLHLKRNLTGSWNYSKQLTSVYLDILTEIATSGSSFENTNALLTGCGKGSIGVEVLKGLLAGGCRVVVTTSSYSRDTVLFYQKIYQIHGSKGSRLYVVPFNQGSKLDCKALIDHIYINLGIDLDYVVPFAAISENGREIDEIEDTSELAHRLMLTNLLRIIGFIKKRKQSNGVNTRPTQIVLPLSPNHGTFGADGLYSESKIGLEVLFNKWKSESWSRYISVVGAVIGWTRGTGLMNSTNILAEGVEKHGVRTFSAKEMGFNILGLMHPMLSSISSVEPIWADLSGGMLLLPDLNDIMRRLRDELTEEASIRSAIARENALDRIVVNGASKAQTLTFEKRANFTFDFPELSNFDVLQSKLLDSNLCSTKLSMQGMLDLDKVVVVVGFAEVGPWGSSRTRWEMESAGTFSITGCLELARIMGFVKFFNGNLTDGKKYIGWIETESGLPIADAQVKAKFEKQILQHTGVRLIEPELFGGYDPQKKNYSQDLILEHDLEPIEVSLEEAQHYKLRHGEKVEIWSSSSDRWFVKFCKGALLMAPKATPFDRLVAGQIPTGWDAKKYGLSQDIIDQVDPCTLWSLVATAEALASAGITDPYELYKHVHVSEVGNALGSGMGGQSSLRGIFKGRYMGEDIQKDVLQESFINTTAGWINLLLLSASGPIKIPVGACATALQSLEIGIDTISSGKAKVMVCGGVDDFSEEGSAEFANMKATSNSQTELAQGRSPSEMSRPTTSSRAGFMEAQGSGVQILMQASLAIEMGAPIYGILGLTNTAMDKQGRSIPAPGQGILSTAKEQKGVVPSPLLDMAYRKRQLEFRRRQIGEWLSNEHEFLQKSISMDKSEGYINECLISLKKEARRQEKEALETWGNGFYKNDPRIAPLRGALAVYGLGIDDVSVVSFHGTSTVANDKNEAEVTNKQFTHLGRSKGNGCAVVAQKWLTGHPKGAAAAWMTNGLIQTILTGLIPGNRNADNIAPELEKYDYLYYPSRSIQTDGIKAGILKSFGFGQVGGEALIIHPDYLLSSLEPAAYEDYRRKNHLRWEKSYRVLHDAMVHENLIKPKTEPPYTAELESSVLLDPTQRVVEENGNFKFHAKNSICVESFLGPSVAARGVGIDTELLSSFPIDNDTFLSRNFTPKEIAECKSRPDPLASFTGRWCAKEAVVKAISSFATDVGSDEKTTLGSASPLTDIEVLCNKEGVPCVELYGFPKSLTEKLGLSEIKISISHAETFAAAVAFATSK